MAYLIDRLKEIGTPVDFEFVSRSPVYNKKKKDGSFMEVVDYTFKVNGEESTEMIFKKTHELVLSKAQPHQVCRASVSPDGKWVNWTLIPFGEDALKMDHPTGTATQKAKKDFVEGARKEEEKWDKIALSKIVHEYMKAGYAAGKSLADCVEDAKVLTTEQFAAVEQLWAERLASEQ